MKSMYASRSVSVLNTPVPNAAYVDDSSSQSESLQRKADMVNGVVQRVVQRETGIVQKVDLPEQFVYRAPENNDLKYIERCIVFTEYDPNLVSSDFTGCMMMAFKFKQSYTCKNFAGGTITVGTDNQSYIAHVFMMGPKDATDTRKALFDAEKDHLIEIEALFKPNVPSDLYRIYGKDNDKLTGKLSQGENGWSANVYAQGSKAYSVLTGNTDSEYKSKPIKTYNSEMLKKQTLAARAFVYATVGEEGNKSFDSIYDDPSFDDDCFLALCEMSSEDGLNDIERKLADRLEGKKAIINEEREKRNNILRPETTSEALPDDNSCCCRIA